VPKVQRFRQILTNVAYMIVFAVVFAAISSFVPSRYTGIVFLIYFVAFMAIMMLVPRLRARKVATKVLESNARVLLKVEQSEVMDLMSKDTELVREAKSFFGKYMLMMIIPFALWFLILYVLRPIIVPPTIKHGTLEMFVRYLILYGIFSAIAFGLRFVTQTQQMPMALTAYEVRENGILSSMIALQFPLDCDRYRINFSYERRFVEIEDRYSGQRIRLYTHDPHKLKEILDKYAFGHCRESSSKT